MNTRSMKFWLALGLITQLVWCGSAAVRPSMDLTGEWSFYPDVGDAMSVPAKAKPGSINVPGAWQAQGYGQPGGTILASIRSVGGTSPADHLRHNLTARCLYVREFEAPASWKGWRIFLAVRRIYAYADVTLNGKRVGEWEGFCSPFEFDVTDAVVFGGRNQLIIGVDNRPRPGRDTYGCMNWFANWGGIGGAIYLEARPPHWLQDVFAMPRIADAQVTLRVSLKTAQSGWPARLTATAEVAPWDATGLSTVPVGRAQRAVASVNGQELAFDLPVAIASLRRWSPDDPFLYEATVRLVSDGRVMDERRVRFGMREITTVGRKLLLNGQPFYLSGYGDDSTEPISGMLPADKGLYLKRLRLMRSLGFNFVRHHSSVPHDQYLDAADEVGMLVQPEAGMAYTHYWPSGHVLFETEWPHIIRAFRNHPCIWAWCMGNELNPEWGLPERGDTSSKAVSLSRPITSGPLQAVADQKNGVFGPPGAFPTETYQGAHYYRDAAALVDGQERTLLGDASTTRVFNDGLHELGLKLTSTRDGEFVRIRYYRVPEETGRHKGHLWDAQGKQLAQAEFANETASGWQEAALPQSVPMKAGRIYVVSVNANTAYAATRSNVNQFTRQDARELVVWAYQQAKQLDPTRPVHASDGGSAQLLSDIVSQGGSDSKPYLLHEYGSYCCSLPDFSLIPRLNGVIRPDTYIRAELFVRKLGLDAVYSRYYRSSLLMRADAQKHYIEEAKASGSNNGYTYWLGIDFPDSPEGCWDEGILNQLWEPKPYLTNHLADINAPTVLLTTVALGARSFYSEETKQVGLRLWHYGAKPIQNAHLSWRLLDGDKTLKTGGTSGISCSIGETKSLGEAVLDGLSSTIPRFVKLQVELRQGEQRVAQNSWEFYAYPRAPRAAPLAGVYSEVGPLPGATLLSTNAPLPADLRVLITRALKRDRHGALLRNGKTAVLLVGTGGLTKAQLGGGSGYFLNGYGCAFGGIIEDHPVFAPIPHEGRFHLGLYQLIAGSQMLNAETMPAALRDGAVVRGLQFSGDDWVSPVKSLRRVALFCDVISENDLHLALCTLDLLADKPESRYVLARTLDYLLAGQPSRLTRQCATADLEGLLR